ncbi:hypothetical protein [Methylomonas sp. TEB]|uniref:hypothetical protein n=1 Tax=Methylomonas sp. TEB TaxID=3398229 RepID=UPI0039F473A8
MEQNTKIKLYRGGLKDQERIELYRDRLKGLEPIRASYHAQKEKTIHAVVGAITGFSAFVFSSANKIIQSGTLETLLAFFVFILVFYIYSLFFLNSQIFFKRGVAAQIFAIYTDLWAISNQRIKADDIGLNDEEAGSLIGCYGISGSAASVKYWSKQFAKNVETSYKKHSLKDSDTILLLLMGMMSLLSIYNYYIQVPQEKSDKAWNSIIQCLQEIIDTAYCL